MRYHYGSETATFFAFSLFCFGFVAWLSIGAGLVGIITVSTNDAKVSVMLRGLFGLVCLLGGGPLFVRRWQRTLRVLRVRWALDAESVQFGLVDARTHKVCVCVFVCVCVRV